MTEHPSHPQAEETDPFWGLDEAIAEVGGERAMLRLRAHMSEERCRQDTDLEEIVPLKARRGTRIYVLARPYVLEPDISITLALYPAPGGTIGEVTASEWEGMRARDIGQAQSWLYREDHTLILWEAYFYAEGRCHPV